MKLITSILMFAWISTSMAAAQSLAELAREERERREKLRQKESSESRTYSEYDLRRSHFGLPTAPAVEGPKPPDTRTEARLAEQQSKGPKQPIVLASLIEESMPEATRDVEFQRSRGGQLPMNPGSKGLTTTGNRFRMPRGASTSDVFFDGTLYTDWFRVAYDDGFSTSQLSNRLKLETGKRPGAGWRFFMDGRHRYRASSATTNKLLLYDARIIYDDVRSPLQMSFGQMNLYETAGVGQLAGGVLGYKLNPSWSVGGYGGLEPDIYAATYDLDYMKYGFFTQFHGSGAKSVALSYNAVRFNGVAEREFIYSSGLIPIADAAVIYGSAEYEIGDGLLAQDRLSHLFLNMRYSFSRSVDVTAYYSAGRGLDFHRFLIEQSKNPDRNSAELERFYYTESYGIRLSVKPHKRMRIFVAQRESEQKDKLIKNHTAQIGASAWNIFGSGIGLYGSYNLNRGDASENDSYRVSVSRGFGPVTWTGYYSSTFNGIRFDRRTGLPEIVRLTDRSTFSNDFFFDVTQTLAFSVEHDLSSRGDEKENTLFFRVIFRF